jgi:hypothetical protein
VGLNSLRIQAAILRIKLRYLDAWNAFGRAGPAATKLLRAGRRRCRQIDAAIAECVYHQYTVLADDRDAVSR